MTTATTTDSLETIRSTPLDAIRVDQAVDLLRDAFDRQGDEEPVAVARFGSGI